MSEFRNKPLAVLDRIYSFLSGRTAINQVETGMPITLVHNLSREAELGAAYGRKDGIFTRTLTNTHVGASTERTSWDINYYVRIGADPVYDPGVDDVSIWLLEFGVQTSSVANLNYISILKAYQAGAFTPQATEIGIPMYYAATGVNSFTSIAAAASQAYTYQDSDVEYKNYSLPMFFPQGTYLCIQTDSGGAVNVQVYTVWWMGRRGTHPPGFP